MGALPLPSRRAVLAGSLATAAGYAALRSGAAAGADRLGTPADDGGVVDLPLLNGPELPAERRGIPGLVRTGPMTVPAYSLLGISWRGAGRPAVRVRTRRGARWSDWNPLVLTADAPDRGTEGIPGLLSTAPRWSGPADGVDVELRGTGVHQPVLHLVDPGRASVADEHHRHHRHGPTWIPAKPHHPKAAPAPMILPRAAWGADETWRNGGPYYNRTIKQVHVHHTATGNDYGVDDVPAILRAIYRYHTHTNGWSDIAYNFLVDQFGRIWEGRYGGVDRPVRGAHTLGFNNTSTGFAVIGNYEATDPGGPVITALVQLAAWKLDAYGRVPSGWTSVRSQGSDKYPAGDKVDLPVIDGHRDTNDTECPGQLLYDLLGNVRGRSQTRADRYNPHDGH